MDFSINKLRVFLSDLVIWHLVHKCVCLALHMVRLQWTRILLFRTPCIEYFKWFNVMFFLFVLYYRQSGHYCINMVSINVYHLIKHKVLLFLTGCFRWLILLSNPDFLTFFFPYLLVISLYLLITEMGIFGTVINTWDFSSKKFQLVLRVSWPISCNISIGWVGKATPYWQAVECEN